ncbi:biotin-dependent carboxyltransferase family protein [Rhizobium leguminosarum]|uniref:5-oxoprolinase subunit C family protein n=1 Tax=Rhizobium leguminosarum TaxID=384 RepID=UPI001C920577|nr:biotin-dependent carboxyltransferase family protein [Rhizobium leguminosarum]MBY2917397.1 biotin-dependent carboxyltransferase family protein [Rhizobium leguminosarum]MBY2972636.1 biotin-dependent carboxyltransferase family protein [Rhizobium leguminosarum]MBY2980036.1 biotin-dependent carboxyltransferase family protein [Rhizobium leguminosarum]MBY3002132.1 biotin-dependent carboxyltransferase family protein [Rhizobium leguminosarum]MBY3008587.1 biotin-dependent carboxyltransferase family p
MPCMSEAVLAINFAGPHVAVQDGGRHGLMRYGVPASGPMDRTSFAAANVAVGNPAGQPAIEVSMGGLVLDCMSGEVTFAVAGGGFIVEHAGDKRGAWMVATLRAGERLAIRPGHWGSWTYLAFAGHIEAKTWLGSMSTHSLSGLGGGRLAAGQTLTIADPDVRDDRNGPITCPVIARPRSELRVVVGPQDRFFSKETLSNFLSSPFRLSDAYDRMGVRLQGPSLAPSVALDMPSEAIVRGSVQVAGDGVATILLADHQTTGGYPKIATVVDSDLDAFVQLRPRDHVGFLAVTPQQAIEHIRLRAATLSRYLAAVRDGPWSALI